MSAMRSGEKSVDWDKEKIRNREDHMKRERMWQTVGRRGMIFFLLFLHKKVLK